MVDHAFNLVYARALMVGMAQDAINVSQCFAYMHSN